MAISVDSSEASRKLCQSQGYTFPLLSDPHADTIEDLARTKTKVGWNELDQELGLQTRAVPTITVFGRTLLLDKEELELLVMEGKSILDNLDAFAKVADKTLFKFRRQVRGEIGDPRLGERAPEPD